MLAQSEQVLDQAGGVLADARMVYLFLYVNDLAASRDFYERTLGLRVLEEDQRSVKYDTGFVILCLNRAQDNGVTVEKGRNNSADIVFLVEDIDAMRAALESRGVQFNETLRYDIGAIVDFYDPDGHWFTLYEPGGDALRWPSAENIRAVWNANGKDERGRRASSEQRQADNANDLYLDDSEIIYLFLFVRDPDEALEFYNRRLGLCDVEGGPCSSGRGGDEEGVIKYDAGGLMLTTHQIIPTRPQSDVDKHGCPPREAHRGHAKRLAMAFHVHDIEAVVDALRQRGIEFSSGLTQAEIGTIAHFEDPTGYVFYLYEPSAEALQWPSGAKIQHILAAEL